MPKPLKLMAVFAHPDDESMGMGAALARYAAEGVETTLVTATRGERGWFGIPPENPGLKALGGMRQAELEEAAKILGIRRVEYLNFIDGDLNKADPEVATRRIVAHIRRLRPQVIVTFGPEGDYGHPDHIAICQLVTGAIVAAANHAYPIPETLAPHQVDKLYYLVNSPQLTAVLKSITGEITIEVDGMQRSTVTWPEWAITTRLELQGHWETARRAILCHKSQLPSLGDIDQMPEEVWPQILLAQNAFYRAFSLVNIPPGIETDFFQGLR